MEEFTPLVYDELCMQRAPADANVAVGSDDLDFGIDVNSPSELGGPVAQSSDEKLSLNGPYRVVFVKWATCKELPVLVERTCFSQNDAVSSNLVEDTERI